MNVLVQVCFMALVTIDARDKTPIYAQLERGLQAAMATSRLKPGDQLPTVRQLAVELSINANTVARVYAELERQGVLATQRGVGTFVRRATPVTRSTAHRERELGTLVERLLVEATALGISTADLLRHLQARIKEKD